ncbi:acyltransferase family protein [Hoeflea ulvae]|uniref:Acyltransferase n=1 Tax=Hoeflea ulvae TaxID=2983764 RepID=A0ABT3YFQ5_9HYPH|nr:acyltransferase family protein [Hoeflea ulvae]MCY0094714.1 acyltransferase [Hoeflea ulvae]
MTYRPDIDGLRAIAVGLVVAFHASPALMPDGFIGVDMFFVISGYLITGIMLRDLKKGTFSIVGFYTRRIRRIFPALLVVVIATLGTGSFLLVGEGFARLVESVVAGLGFVANFLFWSQAGYGDALAATKPLLHLWSLAVEEQFYLLWPLVLAFSFRFRSGVVLSGMLIFLGSFGLCVVWTLHDPNGAYYLPFNRLWEPMAGGLLAMVGYSARGSIERNLCSLVGLALVAASFPMISTLEHFPGWRAVFPVAGTVLIIAAGPASLINRALVLKPLIALGLISYPLYLWHWPALVYARFWSLDRFGTFELSVVASLLAVSAAVVLAWLTYLLVELPIRLQRPSRVAQKLAGGWLALLVVSAGLWFSLPLLGFGVDKTEAQYVAELGRREGTCFMLDGKSNLPPECIDNDPDQTRIALVGDSYAAGFSKALRETPGLSVIEFTSSSCPFNLDFDFAIRPEQCRAINDERLDLILATQPDLIFIASWWQMGAEDDVSQLRNLAQSIQTLLDRTEARIVLYGLSPVLLRLLPICSQGK